MSARAEALRGRILEPVREYHAVAHAPVAFPTTLTPIVQNGHAQRTASTPRVRPAGDASHLDLREEPARFRIL